MIRCARCGAQTHVYRAVQSTDPKAGTEDVPAFELVCLSCAKGSTSIKTSFAIERLEHALRRVKGT